MVKHELITCSLAASVADGIVAIHRQLYDAEGLQHLQESKVLLQLKPVAATVMRNLCLHSPMHTFTKS